MKVAKQIGLRTPSSIITTDKSELCKFVDSQRALTKPMNASFVVKDQGRVFVSYSSLIDTTDAKDLADKLCS
jgi:hypothetical protein